MSVHLVNIPWWQKLLFMRGSQAQSIAQSMVNDKFYHPVVLWKRLETYYDDTNLNRVLDVLLFGICQLLELCLDSSSNATKFISY